jgi:hypothetical protein
MKPILIASPRTGSTIIGKPTPYTNIPEYLILNKTEWNMDKSVIISRLDGCQ